MKYISIPTVIDAFQWTGGPDQTEDPDWIIAAIKAGKVRFGDHHMYIDTLEGVMTASIGDYIILGTEGELYPCKPVVFEKKYRPYKDGTPITYC